MKNKLIAIVDDDETLCCSLADLMRSAGYHAIAFYAAEPFLASFALPVIDCVIADVCLPGLSGLDLAQRLPKLGEDMPIILITALPNLQLSNVAVACGARCLLTKPLAAQVLLDCVGRSLSND